MEFTLENYNFKKAMQMLIDDNVKSILLDNNFTKYKKNYFVREKKHLVQIISFFIEKYNLKAFAYVLPIYIPCDYICNYGIELTGISGCKLLSGKYFTTIYEPEKKNLEIQFNNYQCKHQSDFDKLVNNIVEGVLPEMDRINSLDKLISIIENDKETIFGNQYGENRNRNNVDFFTLAVYKCLSGEYFEGKKRLLLLKQQLESSGELEYELERNIYKYIECLLPALAEINDETPNIFNTKYNAICTEMRKKYKLIE